MNVFDAKRAELEQHEFMMGVERGRLAVALDLLTDSLIMVGQAVLNGMEGAKALIQSVMEELRTQRELARTGDSAIR